MPTTADTAAAVAAAQKSLEEATAAHTAAMAGAAEPRAAETVLVDLLEFFVSRAGNHPTAEALIKEFKAGLAAKAS